MFKKADIFLAVFLIIAGIAASYILSFGQTGGSEIIITVDGQKFGTYSLLQDNEIVIEQESSTNKVTIKDGIVSMSFSNCHGQDCVKHAPISQTGENIICLPHKVVVEVCGDSGGLDTIAR